MVLSEVGHVVQPGAVEDPKDDEQVEAESESAQGGKDDQVCRRAGNVRAGGKARGCEEQEVQGRHGGWLLGDVR